MLPTCNMGPNDRESSAAATLECQAAANIMWQPTP